MEAYLKNTESDRTFAFPYLGTNLDWQGGQNRFASAELPQVDSGSQPQYWQAGSNPSRSIECILEGPDALGQLQLLESWTKKIPEKQSPPVCILNIGTMTCWCVLAGVNATLPLPKFQGENPTRIKVAIAYLVVPEEAISAREAGASR